jgi:hypothetical protein
MEENIEVKRNFLPTILLVLAGLSCILFSTYLNNTQSKQSLPTLTKTVSQPIGAFSPTQTLQNLVSNNNPISYNAKIQDLTPENLRQTLEQHSFVCSSIKKVETEGTPDSYLWHCDRDSGWISYFVDVFGHTEDTIYSIEGSVVQTKSNDAEISEDFLSWFSTIVFPKNGKSQTELKTWVSSTLKNWDGISKSKTLNKIKFTITGTGYVMNLTVEAR